MGLGFTSHGSGSYGGSVSAGVLCAHGCGILPFDYFVGGFEVVNGLVLVHGVEYELLWCWRSCLRGGTKKVMFGVRLSFSARRIRRLRTKQQYTSIPCHFVKGFGRHQSTALL